MEISATGGGDTLFAAAGADVMSTAPDLKAITDTSVSAVKPKFTDIPTDRLLDFLRAQTDVADDATLANVRGSSDKTGASSGIVIFGLQSGRTSRDYVLRFAPLKNAHRIFADYNIGGQFRLQRKLHALGLPVPNARWLDADGEALGLPGFAMDAEVGEVAHGSAFTGGIIAEASPERRDRLFDEVVRTQAVIHAVDWQRAGLQDDTCSAPGRTPIERYVNWFWKTAEWTQPKQMQRLTKVRDWLFANQPDYHLDDYTLVHGDTGLGNYMFREERIVAILDWELAGIVHPAYDLAIHCNMADFFRAMATPEIAATIPTEAEWITRYERVNGATVRDFAYFRKLSTLPSLIVSLSMNRSMPPDMAGPHLEMMETMWAAVES